MLKDSHSTPQETAVLQGFASLEFFGRGKGRGCIILGSKIVFLKPLEL
jgi:hypothetical protein